MEKKIINFSFKAPYLKLGSHTDKTRNIWLIFHGYGQLAEEFIDSFLNIDLVENVLIFPQGLSKFYLKGVDNKIGANWMTSHDRDIDIENYLTYLDQLYNHEIKAHLLDNKLTVLGFSQGGLTASRWINHSNINYDKLMLWGSGLAHEINKVDVQKSFSKGENIVVIGDDDRFISSDQLEKAKHRYSNIDFRYEIFEYRGGHNIYPDILGKII